MADETVTSEIVSEVMPGPTDPVLKKQRAPRRSKGAVEASVATDPAKVDAPAKERKQRGKARQVALVTDAKPKTGKVKSVNAVQNSAKTTANASAPALDDMTELLRLEDENKQLRLKLADKLRAENDDLRRRLGHS